MSNSYLEKLKKASKGSIFVFIDAANLEKSVQSMWVNPKDVPDELRGYVAEDLCWRVDYEKMKICLNRVGNTKDIRFYSANFATKNHNRFLAFLKNGLRFKLRTKFLKEYGDHTDEYPHRKANFDVEIAVDAVHKLKEYKTFILFSGDCDFEFLLKFLRGQGKVTIVFSRTGHVAKELPPACTHYFDVVDFRNEILRVEVKRLEQHVDKQAKNPVQGQDSAVDNR